jgi:hypothetical protein
MGVKRLTRHVAGSALVSLNPCGSEPRFNIEWDLLRFQFVLELTAGDSMRIIDCIPIDTSA